MSQNNFFCLPKQMTYVNYEVLTHAFATNVIDMSQAEIWELQNQQMTDAELQDFLSAHNEYTMSSWTHRYFQISLLHGMLSEIAKVRSKSDNKLKNIKKTQQRSLDEILEESRQREERIQAALQGGKATSAQESEAKPETDSGKGGPTTQ